MRIIATFIAVSNPLPMYEKLEDSHGTKQSYLIGSAEASVGWRFSRRVAARTYILTRVWSAIIEVGVKFSGA